MFFPFLCQFVRRTWPVLFAAWGLLLLGAWPAGSLSELRQLGFALAFGVLLDTFVVRPVLVPAFLILLRSGRLSLTARTEWAPARERMQSQS